MPGLSCGNPSEQFDALRRYAGPGTDGKSLAGNGAVSHLNIGLSFGSVTHLIDPSTGSLINITLPGAHPLHSGFVIRQVVPDGKGGFSVETRGWGTGSSPIFNSNVWLASPVWGSNTSDIGNDARTVIDKDKYREYMAPLYFYPYFLIGSIPKAEDFNRKTTNWRSNFDVEIIPILPHVRRRR